MQNKIVIFEPNELEIALVTYNRCEFVQEWLERCYEQAQKRNIKLSIYDSSTNNDTEEYINSFKNRMCDEQMEYYRVDSNTSVGYKPMLPLLNSESKYVWVAADCRCQDFELLDEKVFPYLKQDIDYAILYERNNEENDEKIYIDKEEFLRECFVSMICIGLSIYKTAMFNPLKEDIQLRNQCDKKYKDNYAIGYIGYSMEMYALKKHKSVFSVVPMINIKPDEKILSWRKQYYKAVIEDLCNIIDGLSDQYKCAEKVLRETWKYLSLDIPILCYEARRHGDLNVSLYMKYKDNGMLERCTLHGDRLERFAYASVDELEKVLEQENETEKKDFEKLCNRNIQRVKDSSKGRDLWIYGAGNGGKILAKCLLEHNIPVRGFLDKDAESIKYYEGMPVKTPNDIDVKNCFIVISLLIWRPHIVSTLLAQEGIEKSNIMYMIMDCD